MTEDPKYHAILQTLQRERLARKAAEKVIEEKSSEIFRVNRELLVLNQNLEKRIIQRTKEIEKNLEDLRISKKIAEDATVSKSLFLSNMSHEIRTPLNGIMGITELLLHEKLPKKSVQMLESIQYSAKNLLKIINEILDFSKIEAGKIEFERIDFNMKQLLNELSNNMTFSAQKKGIDLKIEMSSDLPEFVNGDQGKLSQVLINILGNAIKFTESGYVKVFAGARSNHELLQNLDGIYFCISDTGIGIPKDNLERIFDSFQQSDSSTSRKFGGTGLGLTISKNYIEMQGGKIFVESTIGKGSQFHFVYPCKKLERSTHLNEDKIAKYEFNDLNIHVLLVEDNKLNQFVASQFLNKWKVKVDIANNGLEALDRLTKRDYDVVLMDIQMPYMNGLEAARAIRGKHGSVRQKDVPIIALTANAFDESKNEILKSGMNAFISKPIMPEALHKSIFKLFKA